MKSKHTTTNEKKKNKKRERERSKQVNKSTHCGIINETVVQHKIPLKTTVIKFDHYCVVGDLL